MNIKPTSSNNLFWDQIMNPNATQSNLEGPSVSNLGHLQAPSIDAGENNGLSVPEPSTGYPYQEIYTSFDNLVLGDPVHGHDTPIGSAEDDVLRHLNNILESPSMESPAHDPRLILTSLQNSWTVFPRFDLPHSRLCTFPAWSTGGPYGMHDVEAVSTVGCDISPFNSPGVNGDSPDSSSGQYSQRSSPGKYSGCGLCDLDGGSDLPELNTTQSLRRPRPLLSQYENTHVCTNRNWAPDDGHTRLCKHGLLYGPNRGVYKTGRPHRRYNKLTLEDLEEIMKALEEGSPEPTSEEGHSILFDFLEPIPGKGKASQAYICTFKECGKKIERRDRALGHVRMHLGYRPFVCNGRCGVEGCKEAFACPSYLKSHRQRPKERCARCGSAQFKKEFARHSLRCH